jgi:ferredoxin
VPQVAEVERQVAPAPPRYRNEISKYIIRRSHDCVHCGKCAELCPYGRARRKPGYRQYFCEPLDRTAASAGVRKTESLLRGRLPEIRPADRPRTR